MKKNKTLKRDRVNRALMSIFEYPLTIVEAPMGYGKTTAVREFLSANDVPVLWTFFYSDGDTTDAYWDRIATEVSALDETAGKRFKNLGNPSDISQLRTLISLIIDMDYKPNFTLVMDDVHNAKGILRTGLFGQFIAMLPEDFHIVMLTRDISFLNIAELTSKGLCNVLSQQTLRFTFEEIFAYSTLMGFHSDEDVLRKVSEYTGGWISLAYLILLGLEQGIPIGKSDAINELVEKVLYNAYDEHIQKFLLRLSVMDDFTEQQAQYVTGEKHADEILKKLRQENAFVFHDDTRDIYRIHLVLLDFLRAKAQLDITEVSSLYRRLGEWFLERKSFKLAYAYLCRAGETELVLSLLNEEDAITKDSSEFEGASEMFAAAPRELLFRYPFAYLQYIAALLLLSGDPAAMQDAVSRLEELEIHYNGLAGLHPNCRDRVLAEVSIIRIFSVFNNAEEMISCAHNALQLLDGGGSLLIQRDAEFTFGSPHFLYTYYREPGRLKELSELMAVEFPAFSQLANGCGSGCDYVTLAEYALETGDWQAAELNAFKATYKAQTMKQTGIVLCAGLTLVRLYIFQGKISEALEHLRQLRTNLSQEDSAVYNSTLDLIEGYAYACMARPDGIPEWLRISGIVLDTFLYKSMTFHCIVYGKAALLAKDYLRLEVLTETFPHYFAVFQNQLGFLHNQILNAAAKYRLYGMEIGCAALHEALDMGRTDHLILPFAEYAPDIIDMLRHITQSCSHDSYIIKLLEACEHYLENLRRIPENTITLTARELEVLSLTAEGLRRNEIAVRLVISPGTVKMHLENIYRKLGADGKTAAIKKAQKLKIL